MKWVIESEPIKNFKISKRYPFGQSNFGYIQDYSDLNDSLPDDFEFIQKFPTRFGSTFDLIKRFF